MSWDPEDVVAELAGVLETVERWEHDMEAAGAVNAARAYRDCVVVIRLALYGPGAARGMDGP
jgi:hypothetical protein